MFAVIVHCPAAPVAAMLQLEAVKYALDTTPFSKDPPFGSK